MYARCNRLYTRDDKGICLEDLSAALQVEDEILITRDSKPVAKLVRFVPPTPKRKRWNPEQHAARIKKIFGNKVFPSMDRELAEARADSKL